jgi:hypothetical protein
MIKKYIEQLGSSLLFFVFLFFGKNSFTQTCEPPNAVMFTSFLTRSANANFDRAIRQQQIMTSIILNASTGCSNRIKIYGHLERLAPAYFKIELNQSDKQLDPVPINTISRTLNPTEQLAAFANFNETRLSITGIDFRSIRDSANNIKLPGGTYKLCYSAKYITRNNLIGQEATGPSQVCANFTICGAASAPQFIQPVNNLSLTSQVSVILPTSPVVFSWTPPLSSCGVPPGGYQYDFEIRELFAGQGVQDAINNPFVFRRTGLPSNTFLLDTMLFRNVLQRGRRYAIRVRATGSNPVLPADVERSGFSRVEAFQYGESAAMITQTPFGNVNPTLAYLNFEERRANYWDDQYLKLMARQRADTLIPIAEFIALKLLQNGSGYGLDAIELFYLLNPELIPVKMVQLSQKANMPVLPEVPAVKSRNFAIDHAGNLRPDADENNIYVRYLDTLKSLSKSQNINDNTRQMVNRSINQLESFRRQLSTTDRVTVKTINTLLAEMVYTLRSAKEPTGAIIINPLLIQDITELTAPVNGATAVLNSKSKNQSPTKGYHVVSAAYKEGLPQKESNAEAVEVLYTYEDYYFAATDRILPFNVVVYRAKTPPDIYIICSYRGPQSNF